MTAYTRVTPEPEPLPEPATIPDPKYYNSAGRLLSLMEALQGKQVRQGFGELLGYTNKSVAEGVPKTMEALRDLQNLYEQFIDDVKNSGASEEQRNLLLKGTKKELEARVYIQSTVDTIAPLTDGTRSTLEMAATFIEQEAPMTKDDLKSILDTISELQQQIDGGELDPTLKKVLQELVRMAQDAIARYNIRGVDGLRKAVKNMFGEVCELRGELEEEHRKSKGWGAAKKLLQILDGVVSRAPKYGPLLKSGADKLLGM